MGFRFSLETVLRLRRTLEEVERGRLQKLLGDRASLERQLCDTRSTQEAIAAAVQSLIQQRPTVPGSELRFAAQHIADNVLQAR